MGGFCATQKDTFPSVAWLTRNMYGSSRYDGSHMLIHTVMAHTVVVHTVMSHTMIIHTGIVHTIRSTYNVPGTMLGSSHISRSKRFSEASIAKPTWRGENCTVRWGSESQESFPSAFSCASLAEWINAKRQVSWIWQRERYKESTACVDKGLPTRSPSSVHVGWWGLPCRHAKGDTKRQSVALWGQIF